MHSLPQINQRNTFYLAHHAPKVQNDQSAASDLTMHVPSGSGPGRRTAIFGVWSMHAAMIGSHGDESFYTKE